MNSKHLGWWRRSASTDPPFSPTSPLISATWFIYIWDLVKTSFWFVPGVMVLGAILLSTILLWVDEIVRPRYQHYGILPATPEDTKVILTTLAAVTVAVSGVVFSMTVATLAIAASQFGSRPLRAFMGNHTTQVAQGTFLATTLYCLLVLREVRDGDLQGEYYVPQISVSVGVILAILSLAFLVYFVHRIAVSIQASKVVQSIGRDLDAAIRKLFPEYLGQEPDEHARNGQLQSQVAKLDSEFAVVRTTKEGYLEVLNVEGVMALTMQHDLVIQLAYRPGQFLIRDLPVAKIWPASAVDDTVAKKLNATFIVGGRRTPRQDLECSIYEMAEVAVRALSPGINDPYTAIACIDRLGAGLSRLATRNIPSPYRTDHQGRLRVIVPVPTFPKALAAAFSDIYEYGRNSLVVTLRLLDTLTALALIVQRPDDRAAIQHEADVIRKECERSLAVGFREEALERYERLLHVIRDKPLYMFPQPGELQIGSNGEAGPGVLQRSHRPRTTTG